MGFQSAKFLKIPNIMLDLVTFQKLVEFRKTLHRFPELSGEETETAKRVLEFFTSLMPDKTITGLGGTGLAFVFEGKAKVEATTTGRSRPFGALRPKQGSSGAGAGAGTSDPREVKASQQEDARCFNHQDQNVQKHR